MTPSAAAGISDSDTDERPEQEPEFVIHVVDDHQRPPAPPRQMYRPVAPPLLRFPVQPQAPPRQLDDDDGPPKCSYCVLIKAIHFVVIYTMAIVTLSHASRLPEEYNKGGDRSLIIAGSLIILVIAFTWMVTDVFDKQRC